MSESRQSVFSAELLQVIEAAWTEFLSDRQDLTKGSWLNIKSHKEAFAHGIVRILSQPVAKLQAYRAEVALQFQEVAKSRQQQEENQ